MGYPIYDGHDVHHAAADGNIEVLDFHEFLENLVRSKEYESGAQEGVIKQALDKGTKSLSTKQRWHLDQVVERYDKECDLCGEKVPFMDAWSLDGSYCSGCSNRLSED